MGVNEDKQTIINQLYNIYKEKGFVTEEIILDTVTKYDLTLDEIDYVCDIFLTMGGLIHDESNNNEEVEFSDYTRTDYDKLFNRVISIDEILKPFINEVQKIPPPQKRELDNLLLQTKYDNNFARERIIKMYLRIVIKFAMWHYDNYKLPLAEAIQDGCIGLITALDKCETGKQGLFANYAPWYIRQKITYHASAKNPLLYFPVDVKIKLNNIIISIKQFCEKCPCDDVCNTIIEKISNKLEYNMEEVKVYIDYLKEFESLNDLLISNENIFSDEGLFEKQLFSHSLNMDVRNNISNILSVLNEQEKKIITLHFGLLGNKECSLEELGHQFNLTRERIRQIEFKAFRKILNLPDIIKLKNLLD